MSRGGVDPVGRVGQLGMLFVGPDNRINFCRDPLPNLPHGADTCQLIGKRCGSANRSNASTFSSGIDCSMNFV
jgi:hypothetical protein